MKKLISAILSASICLSMVTAVKAAVTEINDGLEDTSKMLSYSDNLIIEEKDKLGSYQNPTYATSNAGVLEVVYELENLSGFDVVTLNYRGDENIAFYTSNAAEGEYTEIAQYDRTSENIGSSWEKISYKCADIDNAARYFKIVIQQEKNKYIRLDNVHLLTNYDLQLEDYSFKLDGADITDRNIYQSDSLTLRFNQDISGDIPLLSIKSSDNVETTAEGKYGNGNNEIVYEFEPLKFGIYHFVADGFETLTKESFNLDIHAGCEISFAISDTVHFGEEYSITQLIDKITDSEGNELAADNVKITSENEEIISISEDKLQLKKAGEAVLSVEFLLNGRNVTAEKKITLCGAQEIAVSPSEITLKKGESCDISIKVRLSDGTEAVPSNVVSEAVDGTVVQISGNTVKGVNKGATFINISVDYYGETLKTAIPVGVDTEPVKSISRAEIAVNRTEIVAGEKISAVLKGYYAGDTEADMLSADKVLYSDNSDIAKVTEDGYILGVSEGSANIYAEVSLGGVSVVTSKLTVTVLKDEIARAELILPRYYMLKSDKMTAEVRAYTKTGIRIENPSVKYKANGTALSVADNELTADRVGKSEVYAAVEYDGVSVQSDRIEVEVSENNGIQTADFVSGMAINDTYAHSDSWYVENGTGLFSIGESGVSQYFVLKNEEEIKELSLTCYYHTSLQKGEVKLEVSRDGNEYIEIPEKDVTSKNVLDQGVWYYRLMNYSGDLLEGAHYFRLTLTVDITLDSNRAQSVQCIRIHNVNLKYDKPAEIAGISLINASDRPALGTDAQKAAILFSQDIDEKSIDGITLEKNSTGENVKFNGTYENGVYIMNLPKLENTEYTLKISGIRNKFGTASQSYEYTIAPISEQKLTVDDIKVDNGKVSAIITNNTEDNIEASVITAMFDANGYMVGIHIDNNVNISVGSNSFTSDGVSAGTDKAKIFIWSNMRDIYVY